MAVKNDQKLKFSDWSMPQLDDSRIRRSLNSSSAEVVSVDQSHSKVHRPRKSKLLGKLVKCWPSISPCLKGLLLGVLMNSLTLAAVIAISLAPRYKTGVIITNEVPPGTILLFSGNISVLTGSTHRWLLCDGSEVSRSTYKDLFNVIGIMYGSGNGTDTFNLPDFRSRFPLGSNSTNGAQLIAGGAASHVITAAELPTHSHGQGTLQADTGGTHTHTYTDPGHNHGGSTNAGPFGSSGSSIGSGSSSGDATGSHNHIISIGKVNITIHSNGSHGHSVSGSTGMTGGSQPIDLMPPYQTIHYIIRA